MISITNLCKSFGPKVVLANLNLQINDGQVLGLVGINGAGKSTLLRTLCGVYKADVGEILVDGKPSYENEQVKKDFFFLPDEPFYDQNSTPASILALYCSQYDVDKDKYHEYLEHFKINPKEKLNKFSKGMKRQTFISLALAIHPKYLVLDEAFDGLDPLARLMFKRELIDMISDYHSTVIISSHSLRELEDICDSFAIITVVLLSDTISTISLLKYNLARGSSPSNASSKIKYLGLIAKAIDINICLFIPLENLLIFFPLGILK